MKRERGVGENESTKMSASQNETKMSSVGKQSEKRRGAESTGISSRHLDKS